MNRLRWFVIGVLCCGAIASLATLLVVRNAHGFSASGQPTMLETWVARWARSAALPADARTRANPVTDTPEVLADARAHWADHCATCHANDGSGATFMGRHTYPPAPDMRLPTRDPADDGWGAVLHHPERNPPHRDACMGRRKRTRRARFLEAGPVHPPPSEPHRRGESANGEAEFQEPGGAERRRGR